MPKAAARRVRQRDDKVERAATLAYEKEQRKRDAERRKQQDAAEKGSATGTRGDKSPGRLRQGGEHEFLTDAKCTGLEKREKAGEARWNDQRERLREAVRKASW